MFQLVSRCSRRQAPCYFTYESELMACIWRSSWYVEVRAAAVGSADSVISHVCIRLRLWCENVRVREPLTWAALALSYHTYESMHQTVTLNRLHLWRGKVWVREPLTWAALTLWFHTYASDSVTLNRLRLWCENVWVREPLTWVANALSYHRYESEFVVFISASELVGYGTLQKRSRASDHRACATYIVEIIWSSSWVLRSGSCVGKWDEVCFRSGRDVWMIDFVTHSLGLTNSTILSRLYNLHKTDNPTMQTFRTHHISRTMKHTISHLVASHEVEMFGWSVLFCAMHVLGFIYGRVRETSSV